MWHTYWQQLDAIRRRREQARETILFWLTDPDSYSRIAQLQEARLESGFAAYGERMWSYDHQRLESEAMEEVADLLNYLCVAHEKFGGE